MSFYNAALYDLVQTSPTTFTGTLVATYEAMPDGLIESFNARDTNGLAVRCRATLSGTIFTVVHIYSSTMSDNSMPTFPSDDGLQGGSSDVAEKLAIPFINAIHAHGGQSNAFGINTGKGSLDPLYFQEIDNRVKHSLFNKASYDYPIGYSTGTLYHQSGIASALSSAIPFCFELLKEGYHSATVAPYAISGAPISDFAFGTAGYNDIRDMFIEILNESPNNVFVSWTHQQGETDSGLTTTHEEYRDANIALRDNLAVDIFTATGVDLNRVPYLAIGLGPDYIIGQGSSAQSIIIRDAIADIPNFMPYSAYVDLPAGLSRNASSNEGGSADPTHLSAEGQFLIGRELLYPALLEARKNFSPVGLGLVLNMTAGSVPFIGNDATVVTNEPTILDMTAGSVPFIGNDATIDTTPTGLTLEMTAGSVPFIGNDATIVTPPTLTDTLALSPTGLYRSDYGVQETGGNVTQVDDLSGNGNHLVASSGTVTLVSEELVFDGSSDLTFSTGLLNISPRNATVIILLKGTAGTPFQENTGSTATRINLSNTYYMKAGIGTNLQVISSPNIRDDSYRVVAMTLDNTNFKVFHGTTGAGVTETHTETSAAPFASAMQSFLGSAAGADFWTGVINRWGVWQGSALTLSQINDTVAEM